MRVDLVDIAQEKFGDSWSLIVNLDIQIRKQGYFKMNLQLTFDDGPIPAKTALQPILDEVAKRKVKAAFFVLGEEVAQEPAATKTISDAKHVLGNHSWDHLKKGTDKYSDDEILKQFKDTHQLVLDKVKVTMLHWRAPRNDALKRLSDILSGAGKLYSLSHCDFNVDSKDSQGETTAAGMLAAIKEDLKHTPAAQPRLLFHVVDTTAKALPEVLDGLVKAGHTFVDFTQSA
jgi:peptidoglycan/xylan/chitin deacetylase (PgdA/CDA1 family)